MMCEYFEKIIGKNLRQFVEDYITSLVAWDIVVFYHRNPQTHASLATLAQCLGREEDKLVEAVGSLTEKGILKKTSGDKVEPLYVYDLSSELKDKVDEFVHALDNREKRLVIFAHILRKGRV